MVFRRGHEASTIDAVLLEDVEGEGKRDAAVEGKRRVLHRDYFVLQAEALVADEKHGLAAAVAQNAVDQRDSANGNEGDGALVVIRHYAEALCILRSCAARCWRRPSPSPYSIPHAPGFGSAIRIFASANSTIQTIGERGWTGPTCCTPSAWRKRTPVPFARHGRRS